MSAPSSRYATIHRIMFRDGEIVETSEPVKLTHAAELEVLCEALMQRPGEEKKEQEKRKKKEEEELGALRTAEMEMLLRVMKEAKKAEEEDPKNKYAPLDKVIADVTLEAIDDMRAVAQERNKRARLGMNELKQLFIEQCKETQLMKPGEETYEKILHLFSLYTPPPLPDIFERSPAEMIHLIHQGREEKAKKDSTFLLKL